MAPYILAPQFLKKLLEGPIKFHPLDLKVLLALFELTQNKQSLEFDFTLKNIASTLGYTQPELKKGGYIFTPIKRALIIFNTLDNFCSLKQDTKKWTIKWLEPLATELTQINEKKATRFYVFRKSALTDKQLHKNYYLFQFFLLVSMNRTKPTKPLKLRLETLLNAINAKEYLKSPGQLSKLLYKLFQFALQYELNYITLINHSDKSHIINDNLHTLTEKQLNPNLLIQLHYKPLIWPKSKIQIEPALEPFDLEPKSENSNLIETHNTTYKLNLNLAYTPTPKPEHISEPEPNHKPNPEPNLELNPKLNPEPNLELSPKQSTEQSTETNLKSLSEHIDLAINKLNLTLEAKQQTKKAFEELLETLINFQISPEDLAKHLIHLQHDIKQFLKEENTVIRMSMLKFPHLAQKALILSQELNKLLNHS